MFASGGTQMYAVGEYVGSVSELDGWVDAVNASNGGGYDLVGTFDFTDRVLGNPSVRIYRGVYSP